MSRFPPSRFRKERSDLAGRLRPLAVGVYFFVDADAMCRAAPFGGKTFDDFIRRDAGQNDRSDDGEFDVRRNPIHQGNHVFQHAHQGRSDHYTGNGPLPAPQAATAENRRGAWPGK